MAAAAGGGDNGEPTARSTAAELFKSLPKLSRLRDSGCGAPDGPYRTSVSRSALQDVFGCYSPLQ